jgi:zinc transporter ZupT
VLFALSNFFFVNKKVGHKWVEALAVGIEFSKAKRRGAIGGLFVIVNLGMYCCGCSIGIGIGMLLAGAGLLWNSILLGLSTGVFVLVSTTELIPEQFTEIKGGDGHESKWKKGSKFISYCAGVLVMCAFWYFGQKVKIE